MNADHELPDTVRDRPLASVREACAEVAARARSVAIDETRLAEFADALPLARLGDEAPARFPELGGNVETLAAFTLTLDAVNFGSGWFPELAKLPGHSGYRTLEAQLRARFAREGPIPTTELRGFDERAAATLFAQAQRPALAALLALFARALRDLGELVAARYDGSFAGLVEEASGSAEALVRILLEMPLYRDIARYDGLVVPFLKRAQISASDLAHALPESLGRFRDLEKLTIFADNLVPHVLRLEGVLSFEPALVAQIEREELLALGSREEVEIRACAVEAVERMVARLRERGERVNARDIDDWLWQRGGEPRFKARPRHRTRGPYY